MAGLDEIEDGKHHVVGPGHRRRARGRRDDLGIVVEVAGRKMQEDFEPVLERQIHHFVNGASGIQHIGQRDITWIRISKAAVDKGFDLKHLGDILYRPLPRRLRRDRGQGAGDALTPTRRSSRSGWPRRAQAYQDRNIRLADMTDESVDEFYSCTLCQSFAPNHVCVISPERLGLCGAYNWLDCKASFEINPTGPEPADPEGQSASTPTMGVWQGPNEFVYQNHTSAIRGASAMYSIMENPMTACGCFECIVMVIPEANGVMVVSREDPSMTPAGMTFSTLAGVAGGGLQTPGRDGRRQVLPDSAASSSRADGGFKRVVWMSSNLKEP